MSSKIRMGDSVKDVVTGFAGVVVAKIEYITGCTQFGVSPKAKDGKLNDTLYIDEKRLQIVGKRVELVHASPGGPQFDAPRG